MSNEESQAKPAGAGHTFLRPSLDAVLKWFAPRKSEAAPNAKSSPASTEDREAVDESAPDREMSASWTGCRRKTSSLSALKSDT
ncbi:hypothetical protein [Sinorhizobium meliloti]|jgi:hypothetical protein|uniref:hypothetical protein n=1 Tax=Rhizobium meliloti TaxID=382 RepID=UPI003F15E01F